MRTPLTVAAATMGLLATACGTPESRPEAPAGEQAEAERADDRREETSGGTAGLDLDGHCENPQDGYRIRYPGAWHANDGQVTAPCRVFDVEAPEIEPSTVLPLSSAVLVTVEDHRYDEMPTRIEDDPATEVRDVVATELGDRQALRVDGVATGEAYLAEGVAVHRVYVAFGDRTVVGSINDLGEPSFDVRRELVAEMLATLEAFDRSEADVAAAQPENPVVS